MKPSLLLVGLGNPGKQYERTRHNAGYWAMDVLSESFGTGEWKEQGKYQSLTQEARIVTVPVLLMKPLTFMNLSGESVRKAVEFYKLNAAEQVLVCSDDIDIPLGTWRLRKEGSAGTHNGLKSLVDQFGEAFPRLRIGIGPKPEAADLATWVLSAMPEEERAKVDQLLKGLPELVKEFVMEKR